MIMDDSSPAPCPSGPGMGDGFRGIAVAAPEGSRCRMRWALAIRKDDRGHRHGHGRRTMRIRDLRHPVHRIGGPAHGAYERKACARIHPPEPDGVHMPSNVA